MTFRAVLQLLLLGVAAAPGPLMAQASTVVLVRHAEKASNADDPELTEAGRARARALSTALVNLPLQAILVSEYRRTQQTAAPTASANHLVPIVVPASGDAKAGANAIVLALRQMPSGSAALVVGHSNTLGPIIAALGGPQLPDLCDAEYATLFLLELPGGHRPPRLLRASYGQPDPSWEVNCTHGM